MLSVIPKRPCIVADEILQPRLAPFRPCSHRSTREFPVQVRETPFSVLGGPQPAALAMHFRPRLFPSFGAQFWRPGGHRTQSPASTTQTHPDGARPRRQTQSKPASPGCQLRRRRPIRRRHHVASPAATAPSVFRRRLLPPFSRVPRCDRPMPSHPNRCFVGFHRIPLPRPCHGQALDCGPKMVTPTGWPDLLDEISHRREPEGAHYGGLYEREKWTAMLVSSNMSPDKHPLQATLERRRF